MGGRPPQDGTRRLSTREEHETLETGTGVSRRRTRQAENNYNKLIERKILYGKRQTGRSFAK